MPTISIIVPVYKVEPYLNRCVDSILAQSFADFELILVDDGSPDKCPAICDEYEEKDSRVVVIHQKNGGLSAARNAGIDIAQGEFVCFVDSDDFIHRDFCAALYWQMKNSDAIFCACRSYDFEEYRELVNSDEDNNETIAECTYLQFFQERLTLGGFAVWNKMFRKEVVNQIRFENGKIHEDIFFSSALLSFQDRTVISIGCQLYYHLVRAEGIIGSQKTCNPDRVAAGEHMIHCVNQYCPQLLQNAVKYAMSYPWSFVDGIYVRREFVDNREFLRLLRRVLQQPIVYQNLTAFTPIIQRRMKLFAHGKLLFGVNVFMRLMRVYCYRVLGKDPYKNGHGI